MRRILAITLLIFLICGAASAEPTLRPTASATIEIPDDTLYQNIMSNLSQEETNISIIVPILSSAIMPFKNVLGNALFYALLFGVPAFLVWFGSGSAKIPATIGVGLSGFIIPFLPPAWQGIVLILIAVIMTGGFIFLFVSRREQE